MKYVCIQYLESHIVKDYIYINCISILHLGVAYVVDALDLNDRTNLTQPTQPNRRPYIKPQLGFHAHHLVVLAPAATHVRSRRLTPAIVLMRRGVHG
jgi:hypothetical protein